MFNSNLKVAPTRQRYPLLYWATMAFIVGIPNFVHFDSTGRTANAINVTSISMVVETVLIGYLLVVVLLLERRPIVFRKIRIDWALWVALLAEMLLATALQPASRLTAPTALSHWLAVFQIGQWVIAFGLVVALYTRTPPERAMGLVVEMLGRSSWIWIVMVWVMLPIMPMQVYGASEDAATETVRRLGGQFIVPAHLALIGGIAFFHALFFFPKGPRKWVAATVALATVVLTGARAQQAGFLLALFLYAIVFTKRPAIRWGVIGTALFAIMLGGAFSTKVTKYIARGQNAQTLSSLNDRTRVWHASIEAIRERPIIGYGYSVGARNAIKDHWTYAHWIPPHAHNEFLQAALDGGIIGAGILFCIYARVFWRSFRDAGQGPAQLFLFLVVLQFVMNTLTGSELTNWYHGTGGVLMLVCVGVMAGRAERAGRRVTAKRSLSPAFERQRELSAV